MSSSSSATLPRRIIKETQRLAKEPVSGIMINPTAANPRHFMVRLEGPKDTPYQGGLFLLEMFLPEEYPCNPVVN